MKRLITSLLTLLVLLTASATVKEREPEFRTLPGAPSAGITKMKKQVDNGFSHGVNLSQNHRKPKMCLGEDESIVEVKCILKYDSEKYVPLSVAGYNAVEKYGDDYDWENDYVYLYMSPGVYDFMATFTRVVDNSFFGGETGCAYVILENIEVKNNMEIELNAAIITETISFETYNPDGEKTSLRYIRYLNENYDWEIISEYNVYDYFFDNYIIHKDYGIIEGFGGNAGGVEIEAGPLGEWKTEWKSSIYINQVSDRYLLAQLRMLYNEKECWLVPMFADGSNSQLVSNKGEKYSELYDVNFAKSPAGNKCEIVSDSPYGIAWTMNDDLNRPIMYGLRSSLDSFHHFRFCSTQSAMSHPKYVYMMKFSREDTATSKEYYDEDGNLLFQNYTPNMINTPIFVLAMEECNLYPTIDNTTLLSLEGGEEYDFSLESPFSFDISPRTMPVFGSTPQFMQFYYENLDYQWCEYPFPAISYDSYGYYGDHYYPNYAKISISINGNVIATSMEEFGEWQRECMESQMEIGIFTFDYLNENIEIDGLEGKNSALIEFDNSSENIRIPLIQSVQFRDGDNRVTDSLYEAAGATLLIAGGDFCEIKGKVNSEGEQARWYEVELCDIVVEYAPHGSNDYISLDMNVAGDAIAGFGYPYIGYLESVDRKSEAGWFDLRILLTDAKGNSHEQIISPAFKIEKLTGIQPICVNKANLRIIDRSVVADNNAHVEVFTLSGQKVDNNELISGIYIARSGESVAKLWVK